MIYDVSEVSIPISAVMLKNNGTLQGGLFPVIFLYNDNTGALLLDAVAMTEVSTGYYRYMHTHGVSVSTTYNYYIEESSTLIASGKFRVVTGTSDIINTILTDMDTMETTLENAILSVNDNIDSGEGRAT